MSGSYISYVPAAFVWPKRPIPSTCPSLRRSTGRTKAPSVSGRGEAALPIADKIQIEAAVAGCYMGSTVDRPAVVVVVNELAVDVSITTTAR